MINSSDDDDSGKKKCIPAMEDYYECLHHRKEVRRPCRPHQPPDRRKSQ